MICFCLDNWWLRHAESVGKRNIWQGHVSTCEKNRWSRSTEDFEERSHCCQGNDARFCDIRCISTCSLMFSAWAFKCNYWAVLHTILGIALCKVVPTCKPVLEVLLVCACSNESYVQYYLFNVVLDERQMKFSFLQDEVAHTLTENRVLKSTVHPFLTVCWHVYNFITVICRNASNCKLWPYLPT